MATFASRVDERIKTFQQERENDVPALRQRLGILEEKARDTQLEWERRALSHDVDLIRKQIQKKETDEDLIEYLLKTGPYIRDYYHGEVDQDEIENIDDGMDQFTDLGITVTGMTKKGSVYKRYMDEVEGVNEQVTVLQTRHVDKFVCDECDGELFMHTQTAELVCCKCGKAERVMEFTRDNLTYDESRRLDYGGKSGFSYKRVNRFNEILSQVQGRENIDVPEEVLNDIRAELKKARIQRREQITPVRVWKFLKARKETKYYEHRWLICAMLGGIKPPQFDRNLEAELRKMFLMTLEPFERHKPANRKNFVSYPFVISKCLEILGRTEFQAHFSMLKDNKKLHATDVLWKSICDDLNWNFSKTV